MCPSSTDPPNPPCSPRRTFTRTCSCRRRSWTVTSSSHWCVHPWPAISLHRPNPDPLANSIAQNPTTLTIPPAPSQQPTVESSEDEEEAWSKWETANHERYEREKELARRTGRSPSGSSSKQPPSKSGILRQKRPESPVGRRGPRARNDPSYAALLDRRDQNTRKVWQAKMKTGDDDDADSPASASRGRSPGKLRMDESDSDDENYPGSGSGQKGGLVRQVLGAQLATSRQYLASGGSPTDLAPRRTNLVPSPSPRRPSSFSVSPGRRSLTRSTRDYSVSPGRRSVDGTYVPDDDSIAFGRHETFEGRHARERRREQLGIKKPSRRPSNATTDFDPPRLHTATRPKERQENRQAEEEAWRRRALVDYVVQTTVGYGPDHEPRSKHWDDPMLAAAEQAAANVREATGNEDAARAAARRAAAAAAAMVNAAGPGHSPHRKPLSLPAPDDDESGSDYGDFERELALVGGQTSALAIRPARNQRPLPRPRSASPAVRKAPPGPRSRPLSAGRFLRSGKGGAGMSRGRSVAAMEEEADPAHAARLRESLENANGIAQARALAEKAERDARVGMARVAAKHRAAENMERSVRSSPVKSSVKQALRSQFHESRRYVAAHRTPARSRLEDRPEFDLNFTHQGGDGETPGREAFSPIAVRYPSATPGKSFNVADEAAAAQARARELALEAAAAAANRRLMEAEMSVRVGGNRVPVFDPRNKYRGTPGKSPGTRRVNVSGSAEKRHGLSLVRESLGSFL